jgi:hypothetical protein
MVGRDGFGAFLRGAVRPSERLRWRGAGDRLGFAVRGLRFRRGVISPVASSRERAARTGMIETPTALAITLSVRWLSWRSSCSASAPAWSPSGACSRTSARWQPRHVQRWPRRTQRVGGPPSWPGAQRTVTAQVEQVQLGGLIAVSPPERAGDRLPARWVGSPGGVHSALDRASRGHAADSQPSRRPPSRARIRAAAAHRRRGVRRPARRRGGRPIRGSGRAGEQRRQRGSAAYRREAARPRDERQPRSTRHRGSQVVPGRFGSIYPVWGMEAPDRVMVTPL